MRVTSVLSVLFALAATSLAANAQDFSKVKVHLPYAVVAGSTQLAPGDYEIIPLQDRYFKIYSDDRNSFETLLPVTPTSKLARARTTELVLRDDGEGEYVLEQMWIEGSVDGFEFAAPKSAPRERQLASIEVRAEAVR